MEADKIGKGPFTYYGMAPKLGRPKLGRAKLGRPAQSGPTQTGPTWPIWCESLKSRLIIAILIYISIKQLVLYS